MKWKVAHACVRGSSHVRSGLPNQDAAQCVVIPGEGAGGSMAVVAVSDGHGSARHFRSQIGSTLAVSTAVNVMGDFLRPYAARNGAVSLDAAEVQQLERSLVDAWLTAVASDLEHQPLTQEELAELEAADGAESRATVETYPPLAYGATLLVAAATESLVLYLQLGDGEILSVNLNGKTARPLPSDERLIANQTTSLCQPEAWREFRSTWAAEPNLPALVLVSTDGYANSFRSDEDFLKIGEDYLEIIREQGISLLAEDLPEILGEATQQGSGDDITLAILQGELRSAGSGPVRPRLSSSARSALVEQLRAKHSSQQRRLNELSSHLDRTRRHNRRLEGLILLFVLVAAGLAVFAFHDTIFHRSKGAPGIGTISPHSPQGKKPEVPAGGSSGSAPAPKEWMLKLNHGASLKLRKGLEIHAKQIQPGAGDELYARVLEQDGKMLLVNDSQDRWTVKPKAGKSYPVPAGDHVELGADPVEVVFAHGIRGRLTGSSAPAAAPAPPATGTADPVTAIPAGPSPGRPSALRPAPDMPVAPLPPPATQHPEPQA